MDSLSDIPLKRCSKCGIEKQQTLEFFHFEKNIGQFRAQCRQCRNEAGRRRFHPPANSGVKSCTVCGIEYPATPKYFYAQKSRSDGLGSWCKICHAAKLSKGIRKHKKFDTPDGYRQCRVCRQIFPETEDYFHRVSRKTGKFVTICRTCQSANIKEWNRNNVGSRKEYAKQWRIANPQRYKDTMNKCQKDWVARNPDRYRQIKRLAENRRRALKIKAVSSFSSSDWDCCLNWFNGCCAYCGCQRDFWHVLEMEHFIPVSSESFPGTVARNIVPSCTYCNCSKSDRPVETWLISKFGKRRAKKILARIQTYFDSLD